LTPDHDPQGEPDRNDHPDDVTHRARMASYRANVKRIFSGRSIGEAG
jgi:hypothetical protein